MCTDAAGAYCVFPACDAVMEQVPAASRVAVDFATEQIDGVVDAKLTGRPEEADAISDTDPAERRVGGIPAKLMVWVA